MKFKLENEKNIDLKRGKKFYHQIRNELNFQNTNRAEEIEAIKGLLKTETKSDKFTPLHYKAAHIILKFIRRRQYHIQYGSENTIAEKENVHDLIKQIQNKHMKNLKSALTVIDEDYASRYPSSSHIDPIESEEDDISRQYDRSHRSNQMSIKQKASNNTIRVNNTMLAPDYYNIPSRASGSIRRKSNNKLFVRKGTYNDTMRAKNKKHLSSKPTLGEKLQSFSGENREFNNSQMDSQFKLEEGSSNFLKLSFDFRQISNISEKEKVLPNESVNFEATSSMNLPKLDMDESNTDSLSSHVDKSLKATEEDDSELLHQNIFLSETTNKANQANIMKSGIPIKNFKKAKDMQQKGLESARTARKIVNPETNREILGNVWISDYEQKPKNDNDLETKEFLDKEPIIDLFHPLNHKNSTNYEEEL